MGSKKGGKVEKKLMGSKENFFIYCSDTFPYTPKVWLKLLLNPNGTLLSWEGFAYGREFNIPAIVTSDMSNSCVFLWHLDVFYVAHIP